MYPNLINFHPGSILRPRRVPKTYSNNIIIRDNMIINIDIKNNFYNVNEFVLNQF